MRLSTITPALAMNARPVLAQKPLFSAQKAEITLTELKKEMEQTVFIKPDGQTLSGLDYLQAIQRLGHRQSQDKDLNAHRRFALGITVLLGGLPLLHPGIRGELTTLFKPMAAPKDLGLWLDPKNGGTAGPLWAKIWDINEKLQRKGLVTHEYLVHRHGEVSLTPLGKTILQTA